MIDANVVRAAFAATVLALAACESGDPRANSEGPTVTVRDSAGTTITENTVVEPAGIARWIVDTTAAMTIGVDSGDAAYEFNDIGVVRRLPNGMFVLVNGQGHASAFEVRFFDSTGKHLATHGRRGQGPGEFREITSLAAVSGDTLVAVDWTNSRLSWISASKGYLRSIRLEEDRIAQVVGASVAGQLGALVPFGDSLFAIRASHTTSGPNFRVDHATSYHIADLAAGRATPVARYDDPPSKSIQLSSSQASITPVEAGWPMHVVDRTRKRLCSAITSVAEISCVDADGNRQIIRWRTDVIPYTAADRRESEALTRTSMLRQRNRTAADVEAVLGAREWPERYNPFSVLQNDSEGNFWILENVLEESGKKQPRFRVLDPAGRHIAFATAFPVVPVGTRATTHIGPTSVLRSFTDPDGVPKVGVFRIRKD